EGDVLAGSQSRLETAGASLYRAGAATDCRRSSGAFDRFAFPCAGQSIRAAWPRGAVSSRATRWFAWRLGARASSPIAANREFTTRNLCSQWRDYFQAGIGRHSRRARSWLDADAFRDGEDFWRRDGI